MDFIKPYHLFAKKSLDGPATGGIAEYIDSYSEVEDAKKKALEYDWWEIIEDQDEGLRLVESSDSQ